MQSYFSRALIKIDETTCSWEMIWGFQMSVRSRENCRRGSLLWLLTVYLHMKKKTHTLWSSSTGNGKLLYLLSWVLSTHVYSTGSHIDEIKQHQNTAHLLENPNDVNTDNPSYGVRPDHNRGLKCSWHGQTNENLFLCASAFLFVCLFFYFAWPC